VKRRAGAHAVRARRRPDSGAVRRGGTAGVKRDGRPKKELRLAGRIEVRMTDSMETHVPTLPTARAGTVAPAARRSRIGAIPRSHP